MKDFYLPTEDEEQIVLVKWLEHKGWKFTHVGHGNNGSVQLGAKFKRLGVRAGYPDMIIIHPNAGIVCIEMKRREKATASKAQKEWISALKGAGVHATVAYGCDEAILFLKGLGDEH